MKLRAWATLLMAFIMMISSISSAQWGYGMYGGMQMCPYGYGAADGASDEDDELAELAEERRELRREKRELEKSFRQIERDLDTLRESVTTVVKSSWSTVIFEHMDKGMNCSVCGAQPGRVVVEGPQVAPTPGRPIGRPVGQEVVTETVTIIEEVAPTPVPRPATPTPAPPPPAPTPRPATPTPRPIVVTPPPATPVPTPEVVTIRPPARPRPSAAPKPSSTPRDRAENTTVGGGRMPASEVVSAAARLSGTVQAGGGFEDFGPDLGEQMFGADGSPTLCNPARPPYTMNAWRAICRGEGKIDSRVCRDRYFQNGDVKPAQANSCARALDRYRKLTLEMTKAQNRLAKVEDEISNIGYRIGDIKMSRRLDRDMEADCPAGDGSCYERGSTRTRKSKGPSLGQTLLAVGMDALQIGATYTLGKKANEWNARTGHQALPYVASGIMSGAYFPYRTAGLYGGIYGGVNGGFGCSPSMAGGGMMAGPYGMMGPFGMGGGIYGGAGPFGYPGGIGGYPIYGGGMYPPGAGPWGMNGPWGVGQWPGGYPGAGGFVGGIAGGIAGGFAGMPGYAGGFAGMAGGFAGMPGFAGGIAGGFAGMPGYAGGFAGMPGMAGGFAGMPGMAGGFAGMPGMAGGFAMPGMAGGFAGMPGYAGGFATGYAGGFAGMAGMAGGFASPWGIAGGMAGGFMTGMAMDPTLMQQQYQLQLEAQRRQSEQAASRMRLYQGFMQEYMQFQMKWNQYFGSGAGTDMFYTPGAGSGGTLPGGSGPGVGTTPGRTR